MYHLLHFHFFKLRGLGCEASRFDTASNWAIRGIFQGGLSRCMHMIAPNPRCGFFYLQNPTVRCGFSFWTNRTYILLCRAFSYGALHSAHFHTVRCGTNTIKPVENRSAPYPHPRGEALDLKILRKAWTRFCFCESRTVRCGAVRILCFRNVRCGAGSVHGKIIRCGAVFR